MTREEIIEMLIIERNCVERQDTPLCNRHCESCDLVMPTEKVVKAYELAIDLLHQEPTEKPMCDRNICVSNEYNGIGCDECVVNKAEQEADKAESEEQTE